MQDRSKLYLCTLAKVREEAIPQAKPFMQSKFAKALVHHGIAFVNRRGDVVFSGAN